jgi:hypothetical protein
MELKSAGEIDVQQMEIISSKGIAIDVKHMMLSLNIFEDMFSPFITGSVVIKDALDLVNYFPLVGNEVLNLRLATPGFKDKGTFIENSFRIYKLEDREMAGDRVVSYTLHFISVEALLDLNIKISKSYNDNIGNLVKKVLSEYSLNPESDRFHVEPTLNGISYVSNFWSPIKNLNYLAEHAVNVNDSPTFLFFENRNGLNFVSLDTLYGADPVRMFVKDSYSRDINSTKSIRNIERDFSQILDLNIPVSFDYISNIQSGTYSSTLITHDMTTKNYAVRTFDVLDSYDKDKRLNKYPLLSKTLNHSPVSAIATIHKANAVMAGNHDISNSKYFQRRRSLLQLAESVKIQITVLGRTDYTVGQKVELKLYQNKPIDKRDTEEEIRDNMFSGFYLISSIRHNIGVSMHQCTMELVKDSFDINLNKVAK